MIFLYLVLLVISLLFYILFEGMISLVLFVFLLLMPIILVVLNLFVSKHISAELEIQATSSSAGQSIPMSVYINNPSPLPVGCAEIMLEIQVTSASKPERIRISTPVFPGNRQLMTTAFSSEHFGIVSIRIARIRVFDMLKLSRFDLRESQITNNTSPVLILPDPIELSCAVKDYSESGLESEVYSDIKPGDDPSEIFAIRDYADGDRMSRIHWKLTAKQDKLMVKDYSLPLCDSCLILTDTYSDRGLPHSSEIYDALIVTAVSLSSLLSSADTRHRLACFNESTQELEEMPVYNDDDFISAASGLLDSGVCSRAGLAAERYAMRDEAGQRFGHVIYICSAADANTLSALTASGLANRYSVLLCTSPDGTAADIPDTETEIIAVPFNDISSALAEFTV